jgi:acetolactate synthase-1/2/3 large subunit
MRAADLLARTLASTGVHRIFSLSGNQIMPVYDACIDARIEIVHTRHEAAAVFMADAWAQLTGEIGVALVTAAPGAANAVGPLYTARQSESPVLLLTGDSARSQDGKGAFQELDQLAMTRPLTKLSLRASSAGQVGHEVAHAIRTALSGRPGPVHVALPVDVLEAKAEDALLPASADFTVEPAAPGAEELDAIAETMAAAARPLVLCGPSLGRTRFGHGLDALARAIDAPVVAMESPRGLKDPSLGDFAKALFEADLIISLGKRIDFTLGFGAPARPECRWLLVDADEAEHERARRNLDRRLSRVLLADPRAVAAALAARGHAGEARRDWRAHVARLISARGYALDEETSGGRITPVSLCAAVQRQIERAAESVVVCDGGEFGQWSQAVTSGTYRLINGPSGAIGGGLCYAIAARQAKPAATVFALMGDGTVGFHLAEFETAVRKNAPFVAVIGNDERWNAEHQIQLRAYGPERLIGCQLSAARYDQAVVGLGGHGEYVRDPADLDAALGRAVASGKPACVNVAIEGLPAPSGSGH